MAGLLQQAEMGFEDLSGILGRLRKIHAGFGKSLAQGDAADHWEQAVGAQIAKHARVLGVRDTVLLVEVDHPIWKQEVHLRKSMLLARLNEVVRKAPGGEAAQFTDIHLVEPRTQSGSRPATKWIRSSGHKPPKKPDDLK